MKYRIATGYSQTGMWLAHEWGLGGLVAPYSIKEIIKQSPSNPCWFVDDTKLLIHDEEIEIWIVNRTGNAIPAFRYENWRTQLNLLKDKTFPDNVINWHWTDIKWGVF